MPVEVLAVLTADIHIQQLPPPARAGGDWTWYEQMAHALGQLQVLAADHGNVPVICAGDVFDKWSVPPELISFAINYLPQNFYAVPGNHDLPYHNPDELGRSAYWTCVNAGAIQNLRPGLNRAGRQWGVRLWAFPFGTDLEPCDNPEEGCIKLAVVHDYIWRSKSTGHKDAPVEKLASARVADLAGYDCSLWGDNHVPFDVQWGGHRLINAGSLMRRHSDQIDHKPSVGLLLSDGTIRRHYLDISRDVFSPVPNEATPRLAAQAVANTPDMRAFLAELAGLGEGGLDFREAVKRHLAAHPPSRAAARLLLESLESSK